MTKAEYVGVLLLDEYEDRIQDDENLDTDDVVSDIAVWMCDADRHATVINVMVGILKLRGGGGHSIDEDQIRPWLPSNYAQSLSITMRALGKLGFVRQQFTYNSGEPAAWFLQNKAITSSSR